MGKPFDKELQLIDETYKWAAELNVEELTKWIQNLDQGPLYVVGSGGSLSACHIAVLLYQEMGYMAKAVTPLEILYSKKSISKANILFISASGKNKDILFACENCIILEPRSITSICMRPSSPLSKLAQAYAKGRAFDYDLPAGKDGFLATNSLVAFFEILKRAMDRKTIPLPTTILPDSFFVKLQSFLSRVDKNYTFIVLYGGWGQPIAIDLESKIAEAALANVLLADYRNFGHGRHHWFDKRRVNSAILAIVTPDEEELAKKTISLLPENIPAFYLSTPLNSSNAAIELLIRAFHFISGLGRIQQLDPGRPGVPDYGSKLYNLNYKRFYAKKQGSDQEIAIKRKTHTAALTSLDPNAVKFWKSAYAAYRTKLEKAFFGSLVFDYDGTLCGNSTRYQGIGSDLKEILLRVLAKKAIVGIATGRGKSVKEDFKAFVPEKFWDQIVIGYYNGSDVGLLSDDSRPNKTKKSSQDLQEIHSHLTSDLSLSECSFELKPYQITVELGKVLDLTRWKEMVVQIVCQLGLPNIQVLESSHSVDIVDQRYANKLNVVKSCSQLAEKRNMPKTCLCIGDKGQWPGNDFQLLSHEYSLSVDEVSPNSNSGWNFAPAGALNTDATMYYLKNMSFSKKGLALKLL